MEKYPQADVRGTYIAERARNDGTVRRTVMTGTAVWCILVNGSMSNSNLSSMDGHSYAIHAVWQDASGFSSVLASKLGGEQFHHLV